MMFFIILFIKLIYNYIANIICSYRLERAMRSKKLQSISLRNEIMIYKEIICAINIHRKAMELVFMYDMSKILH